MPGPYIIVPNRRKLPSKVAEATNVAAPNSVELIGFSAPVAPGEGSSPVFAAEAQAYFTAAEAQGATFDQTSIDPLYTEEYVKTAINRYVVGLKSDGLWDKMALIPLFCGSSFEGLSVPLKGNQMTLYNFTSPDYKAVGAGAGLKGDGSTKYVDTNFPYNNLSLLSNHYGLYVTTNPLLLSIRRFFGVRGSSGNEVQVFVRDADTIEFDTASGDSRIKLEPDTEFRKYFIVTRRGLADVEGYANGTSFATSDVAGSTSPMADVSPFLFVENGNGSRIGYSDVGMSLLHFGDGLLDAESTTFSLHTNRLMFDLGCETYIDQGIIEAMGLDPDVQTYAENVLGEGGNFVGV
jgi:hypothetical protein